MPHPLRLAGSLALALAALPLAPTAARAARDPREILAAARARAAAGDEAGADAHYRRLLAEAPGSRFAGDAHLAIAERHFEAGRMTLALTHYEAVERITGAESMVGYAIYTLAGWR